MLTTKSLINRKHLKTKYQQKMTANLVLKKSFQMLVTYLFLFQWEKPQIKESKKAFFYATITDGGDKEKLECFVDFCEDAIFEMQVAIALKYT